MIFSFLIFFKKKTMMYYRNIFRIFVKNTNEKKLLLGRWNKPNNINELERKVYLANYDNCGPCGKIKLSEDKNK